MPSHSSSGGGSFSGGRGGGGFSFSGGRGGGVGSPGPSHSGGAFRGPRPYSMFGRTVIISSGGRVGFSFGIFSFIFLLIATIAISGAFSGAIRKYNGELEYNKNLVAESKMYQGMISDYYDDEENNVSEQDRKVQSVDATYSGIYYGDFNRYSSAVLERQTGVYYYCTMWDERGESVDYYFIVYEYEVGLKTYYGQTYASFDYSKGAIRELYQYLGFSNNLSQVQKLVLQIVYKKDDPSKSINLSYFVPENSRVSGTSQTNSEIFESNSFLQDYKANKDRLQNILTVIGVIDGIVLIILIISIVFVVKKAKKQAADEEEQKKQAAEDRAEAKKQRYCMYCGALIDPNDEKCPNCGSSQIIKK